jgi:hypothetical protein
MGDVSKKVFEEIKEKKVAMTPKWHFAVFRVLIFVLLAMLFFLGIFVFSLIYHLIFNFELGGIMKKNSSAQMIVHGLPYFWFLVLGIAVILWVLEFMKTSFGYRIKTSFVAISMILITFVFGFGLHSLGTGEIMENFMENNVPSYGNIVKTPKNFWLQPEKGLLSGEIIDLDEEMKNLTIQDWGERIWEVNYAGAVILKDVKLMNKKKIKIIGKEEGACCFEAEEIRRWSFLEKDD